MNGDDPFTRFREVHEQGKRALMSNQAALAEESFEEAVSLSRYFTSIEARADVMGAYGSSLVNLAESLRKMNANPEIEEPLIEAAEVFRVLSTQIPDEAEPALATTLISLAKVYRGPQFYVDFGRPPLTDPAEMREYRRAKLADGTWVGFMPTFHSPEWQAKAEGPLVEVIPLLRRLARTSRATFEPKLALALNLLGETYINLERNDEAAAPLREAEALYRGLARTDPQFYQPLLTDTLGLLSKATLSTDGPRDRISVLEELLPNLRREGSISEEERVHGVTMAKSGARDRLREALKELAHLYKEAGQPDKSSALWDGELGILMTESLTIRWG